MTDTPSTALAQGFRLVNLAVLPGWVSMVFAPQSRLTRWFLEQDVLFLGLGGVYAVMLGGAMREHPQGMQALSNPSLESIGQFFTKGGHKATFAGWTHYLAFDFFVGRAILQDAQRRAIPHLLVIPALLLTLMSGPIGLAYYQLIVRLRGSK